MYINVDQSTSSTTVFLYNKRLQLLNRVSKSHKQIQKKLGFVEHDANEIYNNVKELVKKISKKIKYNNNLFLSITNQRETFVIFDTISGEPIHNAIVWQCRRGQKICDKINKTKKNVNLIKSKTGLTLDTYFPVSKLLHFLQLNPDIKNRLKKGTALFGTIDTYLIYRLTNQKSYTTDFTNASRTLFFNNNTLQWSKELLNIFNLNLNKLPIVKESSSVFGYTNVNGVLKKPIPISGVIGDSQSSIFANQCFNIGNSKITIGTGSSILTNIGNKFTHKKNILTTLSFVFKGKPYYSYECLINYAGATISWLKDNLQIINSATETNKIFREVSNSNEVFVIPAFVGLSSPHWVPDSKAMIYGLTPSVNKKHIIRASLESIAFQIKDYLDDLETKKKIKYNDIFIDGGLVNNKAFVQFLANILQRKIYITNFADMSSYGAIIMGLLGMNICGNLKDINKFKQKYTSFAPIKQNNDVNSYYQWKKVLNKHYLDK